VDNIAGTLADGTMPGLAYDALLGASLNTGLVYQRIHNGVIVASSQIKTLGDWLSLPETEIKVHVSDGTNTFISLVGDFTEPVILKSEDDDELRITVSEDLSGLLHLKASAGCKEEDR